MFIDKTIQIIKENHERKTFLSVKYIFGNHWEDYLKTHEVRDVEKGEVEKMLSCKDFNRGYFVYHCKCGHELIVPFGCNSRLCSCCGKRHTDKWAERLMKKIIKGVEYRHLTFSMPEILWRFIKEDRSLQKVIMDAAALTIKEMFFQTLKQEVTPGMIEVLHPFGRDLILKPHVHVISTYGGYNRENKFVKLNFVSYNLFHKKWQNNLLTSLKKYLPRNIIDYCFYKYPRGFVAYIKPEKIYSGKHLVKYIGRYVRHPAIANSRIVDYNGKGVTFYYENHDGKKIFKTMSVDDFISAIIQHIPEKNFRLVRYYGIFSRNNKKRLRKTLGLSSIEQKVLFKSVDKRVVFCPICSEKMELILYVKKPPPKDKNLITSW